MTVELLAPAGSYEGVMKNLTCGADAVYVGGAAFGARAYAKNLSREELLSAIDEAHIRGKKLYLTVNTLLKESELYGQLFDYLAPFYEQGLDAVIVQDVGVLRFIRREFPDLPIHASTQMTVTGPDGVSFLKEHGVKRVVMARELTLDEIREIRRQVGIEMEVFIHGALCYSYSGQCLFSSILGGRSGNRGRCAQPCRLPYRAALNGKRLNPGPDSCPLSLKDMNTIDILPEIIGAGVDSLKIEGRMKQPEYAAGVVNIYRKYLDLLAQDPENYSVEEADRRELQALFSRGGSCRGYYETRGTGEMLDLRGDKKVGRPGRQPEELKEKIKGNLILTSDEPAILSLEYKGLTVQAAGDVVQRAQTRPLETERIREQITKTGDTPYEFRELAIQTDGNIFLPVRSLNQLRRNAFGILTEQLAEQYRRGIPLRPAVPKRYRNLRCDMPVFTASCETRRQALALLSFPQIRGIYCNYDFVEEILGRAGDREVYLALPYMMRPGDMQRLEPVIRSSVNRGCAGILARNPEAAAWLLKNGFADRCILDSSLYTWNSESIAFWRECGILRRTAPLELNRRELGSLDNRDSELVVYGYLPMMISAQCIRRNLDHCGKDCAILTLTDRLSKKFYVKCFCDFCYNILYNSLPYSLCGEAEAVRELGFSRMRLSFTVESAREVQKIAGDCLRSFAGKGTEDRYPLTKGHFKRGVE